jgi:hypothetical protein
VGVGSQLQSQKKTGLAVDLRKGNLNVSYSGTAVYWVIKLKVLIILGGKVASFGEPMHMSRF